MEGIEEPTLDEPMAATTAADGMTALDPPSDLFASAPGGAAATGGAVATTAVATEDDEEDAFQAIFADDAADDAGAAGVASMTAVEEATAACPITALDAATATAATATAAAASTSASTAASMSAAATAFDTSTAADAATKATELDKQPEADKPPAGDAADEVYDQELLAEVEAALFSGSEDEAELPATAPGGLQDAIDRLSASAAGVVGGAAEIEAARAAETRSAASRAAAEAEAKGESPAAAALAAARAAGQVPAGAADPSFTEPIKATGGGAVSSSGGGGEPAPPPPPPPPPAAAPEEVAGPPDPDAPDFDETRFTKDQNDQYVHKWLVNYANRAGGGRAMCKDQDCLERHEQGGEKYIEKGDVRIGRRVLMQGRHGSDEGFIQIMWFHARCIFNTFLRSRKSTRVIQTPADLEGFVHLDPEDQDMLRRFIACNDEVRGWRGRGSRGSGGAGGAGAGSKRSLDTPEKSIGAARGGATGSRGPVMEPMAKRRKVDISLKKGDRVWTYCRVRAPTGAGGPGPGDVAVKSAKPELGMIVEEEKDGCFIIQFEKADDEKERLAMYLNPKRAKIRGWLRYPRSFDGKKQRIPLAWIQTSRAPPRLCGCNRQEWGHGCKAYSDSGAELGCCGISCGRGTSTKIWGVGQ